MLPEYNVYENELDEKVVEFPSISFTTPVGEDSSGNEYFVIPNMDNPEENYSFLDRRYDAYMAIRNRDADFLITYDCILDDSLLPVRYVDRKLGEKRQAKNVGNDEIYDLKWGIKILYDKSPFRATYFPGIVVESKEEALKFIEETEEQIATIISQYEKVKPEYKSVIAELVTSRLSPNEKDQSYMTPAQIAFTGDFACCPHQILE